VSHAFSGRVGLVERPLVDVDGPPAAEVLGDRLRVYLAHGSVERQNRAAPLGRRRPSVQEEVDEIASVLARVVVRPVGDDVRLSRAGDRVLGSVHERPVHVDQH